jgi:hypothetical protein
MSQSATSRLSRSATFASIARIGAGLRSSRNHLYSSDLGEVLSSHVVWHNIPIVKFSVFARMRLRFCFTEPSGGLWIDDLASDHLKIMTARLSENSDVAIVVFYPSSSLMHQVTSWVSDWPDSELKISFARSVPKILAALRRADVAVVDATEDPTRAMETFVRATVEPEPVSVAVYTEIMHPGLELFVRSRGAMLLLGPLHGEPWQNLFKAMTASRREVPNYEAPLRQHREIDVQEGRSSTRQSNDTAGDEFRRSA